LRIGIVNCMPGAAEILTRLVQTSGDHQVAWTARTGAEAVDRCESNPPELVLMNLLMPCTDGTEATREIMKRKPCPILILAETGEGNSAKALAALSAGAIDAMSSPLSANSRETGTTLLRKIERIGHLMSQRAHSNEANVSQAKESTGKLVVIGASAGGSVALAEVLSCLPRHFAPAVVIVQHIEARFAPGLAECLNERSELPVSLVREGDGLKSGRVLVAATGDHLVFKGAQKLGYTAEPVGHSYRPSVDVFFDSTLRFFRGRVVGVLLTGMGRDGAQGLKRLRSAGHHTIAQDRKTSAVYGMPKAAAEIGAATEILPLPEIGPRLNQLFVCSSAAPYPAVGGTPHHGLNMAAPTGAGATD
jgi:two-component system response regulator WspF